MAQHLSLCQMHTGLHVFLITHEMFVWSRAHHVLHVFLHIRRRFGNQLVATHVVVFLCAESTTGLKRNPESLGSFVAKPYFGRVQLCVRCWLHTHGF